VLAALSMSRSAMCITLRLRPNWYVPILFLLFAFVANN
jgi:hypothetical protein